ncbi:hypothetical protein JXQ70_12480 [bacterium]|nr:hypothetical protein [bacterium]
MSEQNLNDQTKAENKDVEHDPHQAEVEHRLHLEAQQASGANWFFWISGLSIINSIILLSGGQWSFIIGLGMTQIVDFIALEVAKELGFIASIIAFGLDLVVAGIFIFFGVFSRKKHLWAFVIGMILYAIDGLLFLVVKDFLSIAFHVFALFCLFGGLKANQSLKALDNVKTHTELGLPPSIS